MLFVAAAALAGAIVWSVGAFGTGEPAAASEAPMFHDVSAASGVRHVYDGEFPYFVGGGVAVFDCDGDGFPELFLAGGTNSAALYRNTSGVSGQPSFDRLPSPVTDLIGVVGAYPISLDDDEHSDLVVLRHGDNVVLRGTGDCGFARANEPLRIDGGDAWTTGFSATWEAGAELPTLAFGNYLDLDDAGNRLGTCSDNVLLRPDGNGYADPIPLTPSHCSLSMLFSDWARSGIADLRVSNDQQYYRDGQEQLWRVTPGAAPELYSEEDGWGLVRIFGMGIASHDLTGDGHPEVFLTSMGDNKLQTLATEQPEPIYTDIALERGVTAHRPFVGDNVKPSTAWHAEFEDVNNDGYIDLYIAKGNVDAMAEAAQNDPNNLLIGQPDGRFTEGAASSGLFNVLRTRGAAVVDLDLDGFLDVVEVNRREPVTVWHNGGSRIAGEPNAVGGWLQLQLRQEGANRDAIGAWIEVRTGDVTSTRELTIGGGHAGGQLGWIHFGIGSAAAAEVRVLWPDGEQGEWLDIPANSFAIIERDEPDAVLWNP